MLPLPTRSYHIIRFYAQDEEGAQEGPQEGRGDDGRGGGAQDPKPVQDEGGQEEGGQKEEGKEGEVPFQKTH